MRLRGPPALAAAVLALAGGAVLAVLPGASRPSPRAAASREFQTLVGGLGLGPTLDLSRCDLDFDPRVGNVCPSRHGPLLLGDAYCPHHACSVVFP